MRTLLILSILLILVALGCTLAGEVGPEATKVFADLDALEKGASRRRGRGRVPLHARRTLGCPEVGVGRWCG